MTPPTHTNLGSRDLPPPASVRLDTDSARRLLGALGAAERDGLEAGDFDGVALPGYTLVRRLGAGASGEVFLALREGSDRPVSVKVWRQGQRGERAVRAWRELDLLGECNLSVVPRVLDYGTRAGSLFVATDYIDGLNPIARAAEMSLRERVTLLADIADAVQMLHEHGIIHRDLKPANILVTAAGRVFILDLGLAMLAQRTADTLTLEGQPVGTLGYMSPEQARGERAKVSVRSDVYSLGAIGYHMLCGDTPHPMSESASQSLLRITMTPPRNPRALTTEVPPALAAALAKAVRAEPRERYASAGEFAADLRRWVRGERVLATPPTVWQRMGAWVARHPKAATGVVCGVIALTSTGATFSGLLYLRSRPARVLHDTGPRRWAKLISATGKELAAWDAQVDGNLSAAEMVPLPASLGGGQGVLLSFGPASQERFRSCIVLLRTDDPHGPPLWEFRGDELVMPSLANDPNGIEHRRLTGPGFSPHRVRLAQVTAQSAEPEIVVTFQSNQWSPSMVCVLNMEGEVLFTAWHDGHIWDSAWLSKSQRLICLGVNSQRRWDEYGVIGLFETYPNALFALNLGVNTAPGWIAPQMTSPVLAWYKALVPLEADRLLGRRTLGFNTVGRSGERDPDAIAQPSMTHDDLSVSWIIDGDGRQWGEAILSDKFRGEIPAFEQLRPHWVDWNSVFPASDKLRPATPISVNEPR